MNWLFLVVVILVLLALVAALKDKVALKSDRCLFDSKEPLFSPAERSFLGVLEQALEGKARVFGKVRLGDLVKPAKGLSNSKRVAAQNKVNQKHVDFVICRSTDLRILGVVELDDKSHDREDRAERDVFVDQALTSANIPIVHFPAKKGYQVQEVKTKLLEVLPKSEDATPPEAMPKQEAAETPPVAIFEVKEDPPTCGKCGGAMVKRKAKNGPHAGTWFWACAAFPKCRQVVPIEEG